MVFQIQLHKVVRQVSANCLVWLAMVYLNVPWPMICDDVIAYIRTQPAFEFYFASFNP